MKHLILLQDLSLLPLIIAGVIAICWIIIITDRIYPFLKNTKKNPREGYYGVLAGVPFAILLFGHKIIGLAMELGEIEYIILGSR